MGSAKDTSTAGFSYISGLCLGRDCQRDWKPGALEKIRLPNGVTRGWRQTGRSRYCTFSWSTRRSLIYLCTSGRPSTLSSGIPFNAGVFVPDCWMVGLLSPAIIRLVNATRATATVGRQRRHSSKHRRRLASDAIDNNSQIVSICQAHRSEAATLHPRTR